MVRIEEMLNYFRYDYAQPEDGERFAVTAQLAADPAEALKIIDKGMIPVLADENGDCIRILKQLRVTR